MTNSIAPSGPGSGSPVMAMRSQSVVVVVSMMPCSDDVHDAGRGVRFVDSCGLRPVRRKVKGFAVLERSLRDPQSLLGIGERELDQAIAVAREATRDLEWSVARPDNVRASARGRRTERGGPR